MFDLLTTEELRALRRMLLAASPDTHRAAWSRLEDPWWLAPRGAGNCGMARLCLAAGTELLARLHEPELAESGATRCRISA
jgi:hypothetical protein